MKKFFKRRNALLVFVAIVLLIVTWLSTASLRGRWVARFDVARGRYVILAYGLRLDSFAEYKQVLQERYGIEYRQVGSCIVSPWLASYADAYNQVSEAAITTKFGPNLFKESRDEAITKWKASHKAELEKISRSE